MSGVSKSCPFPLIFIFKVKVQMLRSNTGFIHLIEHYHVKLHQNLTSSIQVICNFLSEKYENGNLSNTDAILMFQRIHTFEAVVAPEINTSYGYRIFSYSCHSTGPRFCFALYPSFDTTFCQSRFLVTVSNPPSLCTTFWHTHVYTYIHNIITALTMLACSRPSGRTDRK